MKRKPYQTFLEFGLYFLAYVILQGFLLGYGRGWLWSVPMDSLLQLLIFFGITVLIYKKDKDSFRSYTYLICCLSAIMLFFMIKILFWNKEPISYLGMPNDLCFMLGYIGGLLWVKKRRVVSALSVLLGLAISITYITQFQYFTHFYATRSFTGSTKEPLNYYNIVLKNKEGELLVLEKDKYYVLDFWHTKCLACFTKMPAFEEVYKQNENANVQFALVNFPLKSDKPGQAEAIIKNKNINVPNWLADDSTMQILNVSRFPTILVLHNNEIIYRSSSLPFTAQTIDGLLAK